VLSKSTVEGFESSCKQAPKTDTVKLHTAVLRDASVAVQMTVVTPCGKHAPAGGLHNTVTPGQLSVAEGAEKFTAAQGSPMREVTAVRLVGQVIVGALSSMTVTVNEQEGPV
jgi:hypothetical protein